ncbi:MAG: hypothetical protein DMF19_13330 [Verrucomicrobia bacterium]|nr:MAG: hypothetical protein DMF19_13330 [Verrucomicrobiota bacterium]
MRLGSLGLRSEVRIILEVITYCRMADTRVSTGHHFGPAHGVVAKPTAAPGDCNARAHEHRLKPDTAKRAIEVADWFAAQQLEILSASRDKARRQIWDEVLALLADKPEGIRASDVYRARIVRNADEAHTLLAAMEAAGVLSGRDEQPERGGHITRIFTGAKK